MEDKKMNKELILAIEALEKENGIDKEIMFDAIEKSLMDEYKAEFDKADNGRVVLDRRTGDFHIYSDRTVVEEVEVPEFLDTKKGKYVSGTEIALADARKIKPGCQLGDVITIEVKSEEFSRKAAKNAKNTIVQTIREQEKNALYNELHAKEKEIVTGVVQRINDNGDMTIDIGRTQAVLKADDNFKDKQFKCGDRIKVYVASVSNRERSGLSVKISRKSQELVKKLFEEEVTEIKDGTVEIMAIAREAGSRTKMAVRANVPHVDPVGACVGINGARVKNIVNELGNEQIDIVNNYIEKIKKLREEHFNYRFPREEVYENNGLIYQLIYGDREYDICTSFEKLYEKTMGMADNIFICSNYAISLALFDQIEKSISLLEDKYNDPSVKNDKEGVYKYRVFCNYAILDFMQNKDKERALKILSDVYISKEDVHYSERSTELNTIIKTIKNFDKCSSASEWMNAYKSNEESIKNYFCLHQQGFLFTTLFDWDDE